MHDKHFTLRLTIQEYKKLLNMSIKTGYTKTALIRQMINNENINPQEIHYQQELHKIFVDNIHRIGNNINQIAHQLNIASNEINSNDLQKIYSQMNEVKEILNEYKEIYKRNKSKAFNTRKTIYHKNKES